MPAAAAGCDAHQRCGRAMDQLLHTPHHTPAAGGAASCSPSAQPCPAEASLPWCDTAPVLCSQSAWALIGCPRRRGTAAGPPGLLRLPLLRPQALGPPVCCGQLGRPQRSTTRNRFSSTAAASAGAQVRPGIQTQPILSSACAPPARQGPHSLARQWHMLLVLPLLPGLPRRLQAARLCELPALPPVP